MHAAQRAPAPRHGAAASSILGNSQLPAHTAPVTSPTLNPRPAAAAPPEPRWTLRLLGAVQADGSGQSITRWPSRATAALLARLALSPDRVHPREELVELLWPGVSLDVGRNRLRQALSALKALLEPPGPHAAAVLLADRSSIRVLPGTIACDVPRFEHCARSGDVAAARALYRGELMPSFYEDWVLDERRRLADLFERIEGGHAHAPTGATPPPTAAAAAPGMPAVASVPTGLPSYWTRAFGAELTASRLHALVGAQRLVTVHGPGGSGKTRLAVDVAQALREGRPWSIDGEAAAPLFERVAFVPLVDCADAPQVLDAICWALKVDPAGEPGARIATVLVGLRTLLVLDNLEQVVNAAGPEVARLLAALPWLHVLVTSRRLLEIDGEQAFELHGLPLPPPDAPLADVAANAAVALFADRARAARGDFRLGPRNVAAIAGLVRLLSGMPLAIELAASRVRGLTPQELLQRLSQDAGTPALDLLARGSQRASPDARHASMRHVVEWSWRQLGDEQAAMMRGLSVFGSPALPEAIAAAVAVAPQRALLLLAELHDASLTRHVETSDSATRYVLLQPVREFAAERTAESEARAARQRLREWLIALVRATPASQVATLAPEVPHVHMALLTAAADGESHQGLSLAVALRLYWASDAPPLTVLLALERALADLDPADTALRSDAHELLCFGRGVAGFAAEALAHAEAAAGAADNDRRRSLALSIWAWALYVAGRFDGPLESLIDESLALAARAGDIYAQAMALRIQTLVICNIRFDYARTERLSAQLQALWERQGHRQMASLARLNQAMMWGLIGRGNEPAVPAIAECERLARESGDWLGAFHAARQLGRIYIRLRRWPEAAAALQRSLQGVWQRNAAQGIAHALLHAAMPMAMGGQLEAAARLDAFAVAHWWALFHGVNAIEARELRRTRRLLQRVLGSARVAALAAEGRAMSLPMAVGLVLDGAALQRSAM